MKADKIYLVGFMGAGKSTVARAMGRATGWRVEDIDERIEARERRTIATIFAQQGEAHFRQLERQALSELIADRHTIVATGGGTFAETDNRALDARRRRRGVARSAAGPRHRPRPPDGRRPLAADRAQLEQLYARRQLAYAHAHLRVDATRPVPEVVEHLLAWIEY